ncbi:unnamed protein product [Spirodela intermedia]|uniref:Uncharacterized protein n=2 Tax=Spirodela intermedia TaxID=51605 RepID=A0A811GE78_SPIIN|nr:unnamed protein product [Spirodela intermedia]CAB1184561.1 unnamed protein product [Spirodela intermedia]
MNGNKVVGLKGVNGWDRPSLRPRPPPPPPPNVLTCEFLKQIRERERR